MVYPSEAVEGLGVGTKAPSQPGKEGIEGGGAVGGGGGSGGGVGVGGGKDVHGNNGNGTGKDDVWDEERLCEGLRRLEEMHNKVYTYIPTPHNHRPPTPQKEKKS